MLSEKSDSWASSFSGRFPGGASDCRDMPESVRRCMSQAVDARMSQPEEVTAATSESGS